MFCIEIISLYVFSFILDHFPNISEGSLKQLVNNKNISYQLLGIKRGCQQFSRIRRQKQKFNFFFICSKRPYRCIKTLFFSKIIFKSSSEFLFWKKIRKFEIGKKEPSLHNFYWAFRAFSQRSHKTTKNYLGFIFS